MIRCKINGREWEGLTWFENLIFGLVSGIAEFLPVSTGAHQELLLKLFGISEISGLQYFTVHLGLLAGVILYSMSDLIRFRRELRLARIPMKRRRRQPDMRIVLDRKLLGSGMLLAALGGFAGGYFRDHFSALSMICIMLVINGAALFLPMLFTSGNKDSRHLSALDGWLFGACAGIGMIPGLSRMALVYSAATIRGVDRQSACRYGILLGIPSLAGYVAADLLALTAAGSGAVTVSVLLNICLLFITSVFGTYLSLSMLKNLTARRSLSDFCYYCWGSALLALILHLSVS